MEIQHAARALTSLGSEIRLRVFRHLISLGTEGDTSGAMARMMGLPASTMSFHLNQLEEAGLVFSWRVSRSIRYAANLWATRGLLLFLVEDCCQANPAACGDIAELGGFARDTTGVDEMSESSDANKVYNVLFLCTGNSARSIMAECILNRLGQRRFRAFSAGSQPKGEVHPFALELLKNQNFPTSDLRSKSWDEFATAGMPELDFVFTVCDNAAEEVCPIWPGQPMTAHWGVPDPAAAEGTEAERHLAFATAMRYLENRISIFVNLPMRSLDKLTLQKRLDEIGQSAPETQPA